MELDKIKRTWVEVALDAIEHNFKAIRAHIGDSEICCVVKADGYGHGANKLAELYSKLGADFFAVSNIDEALELRFSGIKEPVLILGYTPVTLVDKLAQFNITQVVYSLEYATLLSEQAVKTGVSVDIHIKIDTGMSRIGFMCQDFPRDDASLDEIEKVCALTNLNPCGIMAHFAVSDEGEEGREYTLKQLNALKYTVDELKKRGLEFSLVHHANSGAVEYYKDAHLSMVRAGIILYGLAPNPAVDAAIDLKPAMTFKTQIAHVKTLCKDSSVSYGRTFVAQKDMVVATVPVGYADGYFRDFSNEGYMLVNGKKARILGRVCMDQTIIDVTDIENVKIGTEVIIFSDGENGAPTASSLAELANTINYEIICAVSKRVPRVYMRNGKVVDVMYKL